LGDPCSFDVEVADIGLDIFLVLFSFFIFFAFRALGTHRLEEQL